MILFIYSFIMLGIQGPSGSGGPPIPKPGLGEENSQLPIDENIWILIAVAILLGIYMIYRRNRSTNKVS